MAKRTTKVRKAEASLRHRAACCPALNLGEAAAAPVTTPATPPESGDTPGEVVADGGGLQGRRKEPSAGREEGPRKENHERTRSDSNILTYLKSRVSQNTTSIAFLSPCEQRG